MKWLIWIIAFKVLAEKKVREFIGRITQNETFVLIAISAGIGILLYIGVDWFLLRRRRKREQDA